MMVVAELMAVWPPARPFTLQVDNGADNDDHDLAYETLATYFIHNINRLSPTSLQATVLQAERGFDNRPT